MPLFSSLAKYSNLGLLVMRLGVGAMMMVHGYPKLMGGPEMWEKLGGAMGMIGIHFAPAFWGFMAAAAEGIGGMLLVLGLFFRPACLFMFFTMGMAALHHLTDAASTSKVSDASHAIELGFVFLGLLFIGPGKHSVDKK